MRSNSLAFYCKQQNATPKYTGQLPMTAIIGLKILSKCLILMSDVTRQSKTEIVQSLFYILEVSSIYQN